MNAFLTLFMVFLLVLIPVFGVGAADMSSLFGITIPYLAVAIFFAGFAAKIYKWASAPVPFRIPTTGGQQKSLDFIAYNELDNPTTVRTTWARMILEVLTFRSLFRNTETAIHWKEGEEPKVGYFSAKWLWLFALAFHYSFLVIFLRHMRFFTEPVPFFVTMLDSVDSAFQIAQPSLYQSDILLVAGVLFLLGRRLLKPAIRYLSQAADFFPLFLILAIALSGIYMRYMERVNIAAIKKLTMGLATFSPVIPEGITTSFYVHIFLISVLLAYFPFSKLMHMGGVFLSPTRNQANNSRMEHHENPWNPRIPPHSYEAYEDDFREPMAEAGLPLEKPLESTDSTAE